MSGPSETVEHSNACLRSCRLAGLMRTSNPNRLAIGDGSRYERVEVADDHPKKYAVVDQGVRLTTIATAG